MKREVSRAISTGHEVFDMYSFDRHSHLSERIVRSLKYIKTKVLTSFCGRSIFILFYLLLALKNEQRLFQIASVLFAVLYSLRNKAELE